MWCFGVFRFLFLTAKGCLAVSPKKKWQREKRKTITRKEATAGTIMFFITKENPGLSDVFPFCSMSYSTSVFLQ